jgi:hypothetical protein
MGSSYPIMRDGQSSIRKEISRLSEMKCQTIVFWAVVFFFAAPEPCIEDEANRAWRLD